jgi:hypothetical protein
MRCECRRYRIAISPQEVGGMTVQPMSHFIHGGLRAMSESTIS